MSPISFESIIRTLSGEKTATREKRITDCIRLSSSKSQKLAIEKLYSSGRFQKEVQNDYSRVDCLSPEDESC